MSKNQFIETATQPQILQFNKDQNCIAKGTPSHCTVQLDLFGWLVGTRHFHGRGIFTGMFLSSEVLFCCLHVCQNAI